MNILVQWIKNLIFIILFTSLLEMFLPENNLRKYLRIVMGFFIISILISPLTVIFQQDFSHIQNIIPERVVNNNWDEIYERGNEIDSSNQSLLMDYYEDKIIQRVREVVNLYYSDYQQDIQVDLDDDYRIEFLKIFLIDRGINKVEITAVEVDRNQSEDNEGNVSGDISNLDPNIGNLKYNLSQVFQIGVNKIEVYFRTGGA